MLRWIGVWPTLSSFVKYDLEPWDILGGVWFPRERVEAVNKWASAHAFLFLYSFLLCLCPTNFSFWRILLKHPFSLKGFLDLLISRDPC